MQLPLELSDTQKRQYIDAESTFTALEQAETEALAVRGSMFWREQQGRRYLIRMSERMRCMPMKRPAACVLNRLPQPHKTSICCSTHKNA